MTNAYNPIPSQEPNATLRIPICNVGRTVVQDISGDFSLPDYQPEIKRLLRIGVSALPPHVYATRDNLDLGGNMDYFVLYTGNDDALYCAPLTSEYHLTAPLSDGNSPMSANLSAWRGDEPTCTCHVTTDMVTGRVISPRRLNIKCRLSAQVNAYATCPADVSGMSDSTPMDTQTLTSQTENLCLLREMGDTLPLQDDMILSPEDEANLRVICAEGQVMVHEVTPAADMVTCRGEVWLKLTLAMGDPNANEGLPTVTHRKIPFTQAVDMVGVTPDFSACAHGCCQALSVEIGEGRLHTEVGVLLEVLAQNNIPTSYIKDLYTTRRQTTGTYTTYQTQQSMGCLNGNFTLSDSLPLSDVGIPSSARVVDVTATATPESLKTQRGKYLLSGTCHIHVIMHNNGEYTTAEFDLPFRYEFENRTSNLDATTDETPITFGGRMQAMSCRARVDGERIGVDAELSVMLHMTKENNITTLSSVSVGEEVSRRRGEYVICFPAPNDTLWSVAKRYNAPLTTLSAANGLTTLSTPDDKNSLEGVRYLIV